MATQSQAKRTIKLRQADAQGRQFIRVSGRNKTNWASCNFTKSPFKQNLSLPSVHGDPKKALMAIFLAIFSIPLASFAFASLAAQTGEVVLVSVGDAAGNLIGFKYVTLASIRGFLTATQAYQLLAGNELFFSGLNFLSNIIKQPEGANFNKPCNSDPGQGKF